MKCVKALRGTGLEDVVLVPLDAPGAVVVPDPARVVPLAAVFALEELLPALLTEPRTVVPVWLLDVVDKAEELLTVESVELAVVLFDDERAEVELAEEDTPVVEEAVNSAFPEDAVVPAPAPEEDPAVLEATAAVVPLVEP